MVAYLSFLCDAIEGFWCNALTIQLTPANVVLCCSDGASEEENTMKLMKVAWATLPLGVVITAVACFLVFWWQQISYSNPYAQAILINGKSPVSAFRFPTMWCC